MGFDLKEEIESYGKYISLVHLKDRKKMDFQLS